MMSPPACCVCLYEKKKMYTYDEEFFLVLFCLIILRLCDVIPHFDKFYDWSWLNELVNEWEQDVESKGQIVRDSEKENV